jgi:hypothetical protein
MLRQPPARPPRRGRGQVILVPGAQKIVRDVAAGMRRIHEAVTPGRVTAIIVNKRLGV